MILFCTSDYSCIYFFVDACLGGSRIIVINKRERDGHNRKRLDAELSISTPMEFITNNTICVLTFKRFTFNLRWLSLLYKRYVRKFHQYYLLFS